ncbi:MAG: cyclic nucleotide-binding domain-containing protein, partial [Candidatus Sericytochromatia bacterium]|nr:cyclic nucleotide-binding domain-containing protein [Candidatus Tanganyikabacteria bacterium]
MDLRDFPPNVLDLQLFDGMSAEEVLQVIRRCAKLSITGGQSLMKSGELADCCYLILKGRVEVRARQENRKMTTLATLDAGQLVGEMGLFRDKPYRVADGVVVKDSVVVQINYHYLKRLEGVNPEVAAKLTRNLQRIAASRLKSMKVAQDSGSYTLAAAGEEMRMARSALYAQLDASSRDSAPQAAPPAPPPPALVPIQIKMALARCPLFQGFDEAELQTLIGSVHPRRYSEGDPVVMAGEPADCIYVVALGRLQVLLCVDGEYQPIASLTAGQCFGERPLVFGDGVRSATVVAESPATVMRLYYNDLHGATTTRPETRVKFEDNLARLIGAQLD